MEYAIEGLAHLPGGDEEVFKLFALGQIPFNKIHSGGKQVATPVAQVVIYNGLVALCYQQGCDCTTYVPCPTSDHDFHKKLSFPKHFGLP
jgi:hypothetical protein